MNLVQLSTCVTKDAVEYHILNLMNSVIELGWSHTVDDTIFTFEAVNNTLHGKSLLRQHESYGSLHYLLAANCSGGYFRRKASSPSSPPLLEKTGTWIGHSRQNIFWTIRS
ncbi:uncharacterized protein [Periplaneta americana]|uniref:uncharacterized protein isoform X1 n=1 Tax=Periplaneta americana TaxID=6978 RepID=UPI0037E8395D